MMIRLSLRVSDKPLERHLRAVARHQGISLSKAALNLMRKGAGLIGQGEPIGGALDHLIGCCSEEQELETLASIAGSEVVDQSLWT